ncbi:4923_t:CDS:2 [Funneliformis mosseae]|uniref:4923_t:CDS:1 n=1 Tax=Funneliformis mosseae TaxID=27381 RepID=A0A9N9DWR5_FUNMO|nr:4923_t:CDS:2 [Funneliformis mosseae]
MYSVLLVDHDLKTPDDFDFEDLKKKHDIQKANDNNLYASLEELYELYYDIIKKVNHERSDDEIEQMFKAMAI